ncbi:MAG: CHAT domain-containing protein, partial [Cyanobacteria bacterium P01_H01_bin.152]
QVGGVISTLWKVESAATAILMVQVYRELQQGKSLSTALEKARTFLRTATQADLIQWLDWAIPKLPRSLSLILESERKLIRMMTTEQPYSHPYFWAAFTLSGL